MENNKIQHPTIEDYQRLEDFSDVVLGIQSTLARLNNHIEVLKRVGDIDALRHAHDELFDFRAKLISSYKTTLSHGKEN